MSEGREGWEAGSGAGGSLSSREGGGWPDASSPEPQPAAPGVCDRGEPGRGAAEGEKNKGKDTGVDL